MAGAVALALAPFVLPAPAGLPHDACHYAAVFLAAIVAMMLTALPAGAIGLAAVATIAVAGWAAPGAGASARWALSGFGEPAVWLTVGAFAFAQGYRESGLGRRIALVLVSRLGARPLGLGYAIALTDLALAPGTPSNTARSGGTIFPVVREIPPIYGSLPGPTASRLGTALLWTAFASTAITSSMFVTSLVPTAAALALAERLAGLRIGWWDYTMAFAPAGVLLLALVPWLAARACPPSVTDTARAVAWARAELHAMGPLSRRERAMAALAACAVAAWIAGSEATRALPLVPGGAVDPAVVVLLAIVAMLALRVLSWDDLLGDRDTWSMLLHFATMLALADGLQRTGFTAWVGGRLSGPFAGVDPLAALYGLLALFYASHYLFASITAHAVAVLPLVLAAGAAIPGMRLDALALLCVQSLGLMGVISPYATGCAPLYAASGYIPRGRFWLLGLGFGLLYFAVLAGVAAPWVLGVILAPAAQAWRAGVAA